MSRQYKLLKSIQVPPVNPESFDFSWIDSDSQRYYLTDRTNKSVDVLDTESETFVASIGGFVGFTGKGEDSGPNGLEALPALNQLWAGDGDSTVKMIDTSTGAIGATVSTGGRKRVDLLACDPRHKIVMAINDKDSPPFLTFISAGDRTVMGRLECHEVIFGPEQPVWNDREGAFYMAATQTKGKPGGEVYIIDPVKMEIVRTFDGVGCAPVGLALGPNHNVFLGGGGPGVGPTVQSKSAVIDARDGHVISSIPQVGGIDQAWYNPGDRRFYSAASAMTSDGSSAGSPTPVMGVVDAWTNSWVINVPTGRGAHSITANSRNNHIWTPIKGAGIAVFAESA